MWLLILATFWRQDTTKSQSTKECVLVLKLPTLIQLDFAKHTNVRYFLDCGKLTVLLNIRMQQNSIA